MKLRIANIRSRIKEEKLMELNMGEKFPSNKLN